MQSILTIYLIQNGEEAFDYVLELLEKYESLGPLPGLLLPFIEAFVPFLPLFVFVMANSAAYGLLKGFIYCRLGASRGAIGVVLTVRTLSSWKYMGTVKQ